MVGEEVKVQEEPSPSRLDNDWERFEEVENKPKPKRGRQANSRKYDEYEEDEDNEEDDVIESRLIINGQVQKTKQAWEIELERLMRKRDEPLAAKKASKVPVDAYQSQLPSKKAIKAERKQKNSRSSSR